MSKTAEGVVDAGLGLSEFLGSSNSVGEGDQTPSQPAAVEPKADASETTQTAEAAQVKEVPVAAETPKAEPEPSVSATPVVNWDTDENPYKKRYVDTAGWATQINRQLTELKQSQEIVGKKLDGTFDPATDTVPLPSPQEIETNALLRGKVAASESLAKEHYGNEYVEQTLAAFNAQFGTNTAIQGRVLSSDAPIVEAIKVMRERAFYDKYGSDPESITKKIREDVEKELRPKIAEEEAKRFAERLTQRDQTPTGLAGARGTGDTSAPKTTGPVPLKSIFGA